jgi:hypothetical protein
MGLQNPVPVPESVPVLVPGAGAALLAAGTGCVCVCPSTMYNERPSALMGTTQRTNSTDFWPSRWPRNPPATPAAVPAASGEFGARNSPRAGRNTTGGWLADDPRVVRGAAPPTRVRGGVVLGLVYRSAGSVLPAAPGHGDTAIRPMHRAGERN